jgi:multidrug efflux pump subunit AcrA (membrane-fusion protein)
MDGTHLNEQNSMFPIALRIACVGLILVVAMLGDLAVASPQDSMVQASDSIRIAGAIVKTPPPVKIPAAQAGVLMKVGVREGSRVERGQFLAQVDSSEFELELQQAKLDADLAQMNATNTTDIRFFEKSLGVSTAEVERSIAANSRVNNSVPLAKLEKQKLERDRAALQLEQARKQREIAVFRTKLTATKIQSAQQELERTRIVAPISGLVVGVAKQVGEWVQQSDVVCELVSTDRLRVEGLASAANASRLSVGMPATVVFNSKWLEERSVTGKVMFISPSANPVSSQVSVWVEIKNPTGKIPAGIRGDILISLE